MSHTAKQLATLFEVKIGSAQRGDQLKFKKNGNHYDYHFLDAVDGEFTIQLFDGEAIVIGKYGKEKFTSEKIVADILEYLGEFDIPSYDFPANDLL